MVQDLYSSSTALQAALSVFETIPEPYLVLSANFEILTASNEYLEQAGISRDELRVGALHSLFSRTLDESAESFFFALEQALALKKPVRTELAEYPPFTRHQQSRLGGDRRWSVVNTPVMDDKGDILYVLHKASERIVTPQKDGELFDITVWQQQFGNLVETMTDSVSRWDKELKLVYANRAFRSATGLSDDSPLGMTAMELGPGEIAKPYMEKVRAVFEVGQPGKELVSFGNKYYDTRLIPEKAADGTVLSVLRIARDITDLKEAEKMLKESRDLLQAVFEESPNSISVLSIIYTGSGDVEDFEIVIANDFTFKMTGGRDIIGKRYIESFPESLENGLFEKFRAIACQGGMAEFELEYGGKGTQHWLRVIVTKLENMLVVTTEDITERKKAELELIHSKDFLQSIIDASLSTISVRKAIRDEEGRIIDFEWVLLNKKAHTFWKGQEVLGKRQTEVSPVSQMNGVFDRFVSTVEEGREHIFEQDFLIEGKHFWVRINSSKLDDGLVISAQDITEEKLAEQHIKANNELFKSVFNSAVSGVTVYRAVRNDAGEIIDFQVEISSELTRQMLGQTDLKGQRLIELLPALKDTVYFQKMVEVVDKDILYEDQEELTLLGLDNTWVCRRAVKFEDGLITSWTDISGLKLAEEQLTRQYEILKQAEDVASIGSWEYDIRNDKLRWSDGMFELFELEKEQYIYPALYLKYIVPADKSRMKAIIKAVKQEFKAFEDEITLKIKGKKKVLRIKAGVSFDIEGNPQKMSGMVMDVTARRAAEEELRELQQNRFQELLNAVIHAQEEERRHIAEAMHNEFGQLLSVAKMKIKGSPEATKLLDEAITQVRNIAYELMPTILNDFGLEFALKDMAAKKLTDAGICYALKISGLKIIVDPMIEVAVFRIIQELLNNVVKHSGASHVSLQVTGSEDKLYIRLKDNGVGFQVKIDDLNQSGGFGLKYISDRVHLHNGTICFDQNKGSAVSIEMPLPREKKPV
ncbi:PAS domain-containing protein [Flavihumibacter sp. R14]|nr:PAS domain-containing protein [Flavihumibacter soli]